MGVTESGVERWRDLDVDGRGRRVLRPIPLERDPRRRPSAGRHSSTCRIPTSRRATPIVRDATASAGELPWTNSRAASCSRICGCASPPIVPNTAASSPSRVAIAGHSVWGGRRPGRSSAGWPSCRLNPSPRSCRLMPVVGSTSHEPNPAALDWMRLTAVPPASAVHRYVVSPDAAATGLLPACSTSTSPARSSIAASSVAPSAQSWSTSGRSKPAVAAASTSTCAQPASVQSSGTPTRSASRAAPSRR